MPSHSTPPATPAKSATTHTADAGHKAASAALALGALGVVFGDIGTSPLYTLKECMTTAGGAKAGVEDMFGILSLMFWALVMVVTVKYLTFVMRAENPAAIRKSSLPSRRTMAWHSFTVMDSAAA